MNLYRAQYETREHHMRRMTFAAPDATEAHRIASEWQLADDTLRAVVPLRPIARPVFELNSTH